MIIPKHLQGKSPSPGIERDWMGFCILSEFVVEHRVHQWLRWGGLQKQSNAMSVRCHYQNGALVWLSFDIKVGNEQKGMCNVLICSTIIEHASTLRFSCVQCS